MKQNYLIKSGCKVTASFSMVDGFTVTILKLKLCQVEHLIEMFDLKYQHQQRSTDERFKYIGKFKSLIIEIICYDFEARLIIRGSLHKYYHTHNNNDFTWSEVLQSVNDIIKNFVTDIIQVYQNGSINKIKQLNFPLTKLEVGINIEVGIDDLPSFLDLHLLQHRKVKFQISDDLVYTCKHENYYLKIYPKGRNLLRIEIVLLSNELKKYKIKNLFDLTKDKIKPVAERLKSEIREIIFDDGIDIYSAKDLTKSEERKLLRFTSDWVHKRYLNNNKNLSKKDKKNANQRMWQANATAKKILNNKGVGYKDHIVALVDQKVDQMLNMPVNDFKLNHRFLGTDEAIII